MNKATLQQQALELYQQGKSLREIAELLRVGKSTIQRWVKSLPETNVPPVPGHVPQEEWDGTDGTPVGQDSVEEGKVKQGQNTHTLTEWYSEPNSTANTTVTWDNYDGTLVERDCNEPEDSTACPAINRDIPDGTPAERDYVEEAKTGQEQNAQPSAKQDSNEPEGVTVSPIRKWDSVFEEYYDPRHPDYIENVPIGFNTIEEYALWYYENIQGKDEPEASIACPTMLWDGNMKEFYDPRDPSYIHDVPTGFESMDEYTLWYQEKVWGIKAPGPDIRLRKWDSYEVEANRQLKKCIGALLQAIEEDAPVLPKLDAILLGIDALVKGSLWSLLPRDYPFRVLIEDLELRVRRTAAYFDGIGEERAGKFAMSEEMEKELRDVLMAIYQPRNKKTKEKEEEKPASKLPSVDEMIELFVNRDNSKK